MKKLKLKLGKFGKAKFKSLMKSLKGFGKKWKKAPRRSKTKVKNEAARMFLAVTALILTAMLTNPTADNRIDRGTPVAEKKVEKKKTTKPSEKEISYVAFRGRR